MDEAQITGATSSYARKYALNGLLAIDDTRDADATNTHDKGTDNFSKEAAAAKAAQTKAINKAIAAGASSYEQPKPQKHYRSVTKPALSGSMNKHRKLTAKQRSLK